MVARRVLARPAAAGAAAQAPAGRCAAEGTTYLTASAPPRLAPLTASAGGTSAARSLLSLRHSSNALPGTGGRAHVLRSRGIHRCLAPSLAQGSARSHGCAAGDDESRRAILFVNTGVPIR